MRKPEKESESSRPEPDALDTSHLQRNLSQRTSRGVLMSVGSSVLLVFVQILQLVLLSRLLNSTDFGLVGMAMVVVMFVRMFSDFNLSAATIQRERISHELVSTLFFFDVAAATALMLLCWAAAPVAAEIFNEPRVAAMIFVLGATFPLTALRNQHRALLARRMLFFKLNAITLASSIVGLLAAVICAGSFGLGYWSIVAGTVAAVLVDVVLSWTFSPWRPTWDTSWQEAQSSVDFGIKILGTNISSWVWKQSDNALIGYRWGAAELGFYARAYSVLQVPVSLISGPIGSAVIPALSRLQNDKARWSAMLLSSARVMAFFGGLVSVIFLVSSEFFVRVLLGADWKRSEGILYLLALSIFPSMIWELSRFIFLSLGRSDVMFKYSIVAALIHLAGFLYGVSYGPEGVAIALAIASSIVALPLLSVCSRISGLSLGSLVAQLIPSLIAAIFVWATSLSIFSAFSLGATISSAILKVLIVAFLFCVVHLLTCFVHAGWKRDVLSAASQLNTCWRKSLFRGGRR